MPRLPEVLPTPERIAKGDMDCVRDDLGNILYASAKDNTVLAWLIREEILEPRDGDYATAFLMCRHAFLSPVARTRSCLYMPDLSKGIPVSAGVAASVYSKLLQWLPNSDRMAIEHAIDTPYSRFDYRLLGFNYREAFSTLARRYKDATKHVDEDR